MDIPANLFFPHSAQEAIEVQKALVKRLRLEDDFADPQFIGGMDVSHNPFDPEQIIHAAVVILSFPELKVVEEVTLTEKQTFPYIPGLLGFRESPALLHAFEKVKRKPDLLFVDGHGITHPRKLGIASHIGVLLDMPTIGVAKSILIGQPEKELELQAGSLASLLWKGEELGVFLRSKARSLPLIISPGHRMTLPSAVKWVKNCLKGYKLPEPTRQAHLAANRCRVRWAQEEHKLAPQ